MITNLGRVRFLYTDLTPEQKAELKGENAQIEITKDAEGNVVITGTDEEHGTTTQTVEIDAFTGATGSVAGKKGLVPAPAKDEDGKFLRGDGTWAPVDMSEMTGASATENGTSGKVPAPVRGEQDHFLKGDGTWAEIQIDEMTGATASKNGIAGLVPAPSKGEQDFFLSGSGEWKQVKATSTVISATEPTDQEENEFWLQIYD